MTGVFTKLKSFALRTLWTESDELKRRRRLRLYFATPFAFVTGIIWGAMAAPMLGGSGLLWSALGATSFSLLIYLEQLLMPVVVEAIERRKAGFAGIAGLAWEGLVIGGLAFLFTSIFTVPVIPLVGAALGFGAVYAVGMEYLVGGAAAEAAVTMIYGGGAAPREGADLSLGESLVVRGDFEGANAIYAREISANPRNGAAYTHLARSHVAAGRAEDAVEVLRLCVRRAALTPKQDAFVVRRIVEICDGHLGGGTLAEEDVQDFLDREPPAPYDEWALRTLDEIVYGLPAPEAPEIEPIGEIVPGDLANLHDRFSVEEDYSVPDGQRLETTEVSGAHEGADDSVPESAPMEDVIVFEDEHDLRLYDFDGGDRPSRKGD